MSEVFILWDIDGTLNVHGRVTSWPGKWSESLVARQEAPELFSGVPEKFHDMPLRVSDALLDSMTSLSAQSGVTSCWFSAWGEKACSVFSPKFGFSAGQSWFAFADTSSLKPSNPEQPEVWWKTSALREFLIANPGARVIWVDDLLDDNENYERDNHSLLADFGDRVAMVGVMPHVGVTPDVFSFINRLATSHWENGLFVFE